MFNADSVRAEIVKWIRDWFEVNGKGCNAVIGISGGKDSSVVAALCVEALGRNRVVGVLMPNGVQRDYSDAVDLCRFLDIKNMTVNIKSTIDALTAEIKACVSSITSQTTINLPPRIRMSTLYAVSQSMNGRVANTCNYSEDYVGYSTRYGDSCGDFAPIADLTSEEVVAIGDSYGLPRYLAHKTPSDGLCGKTDEDNFGFTYAVLNKYLRTGVCDDKKALEKIESMHKKNEFKMLPMPKFILKQ